MKWMGALPPVAFVIFRSLGADKYFERTVLLQMRIVIEIKVAQCFSKRGKTAGAVREHRARADDLKIRDMHRAAKPVELVHAFRVDRRHVIGVIRIGK